jgi:hypothetical protein
MQAELPDSTAEHDLCLYLTGRPMLEHFLNFMAGRAVDPPRHGTLIDQWHEANSIVQELQKSEDGRADNPAFVSLLEFGDEYEPLLTELLKDPILQNSFNAVPTQLALVELDSLVVYQKDVNVTHTSRIEQRLKDSLDREVIFRACLPPDHPRPPCRWAKVKDDVYTFVSPSRDLRFLDAVGLESGDVNGYSSSGDMVGMIGAAVGFGSNFLNAIYLENRLILNNGTHRAYALRRLGVTHVPCIVQHVPSREALEVVASGDILKDPDRLLRHPRPTMLPDYLDPRLHIITPVRRRLRQITVRVEVTESYLPVV